MTIQAPPIWRTFWALFGASNQLLAALTLLGITVWLWKTRRVWWVWLVTGIPTVWMYAMSTWALASMTYPKFFKDAAHLGWPLAPVQLLLDRPVGIVANQDRGLVPVESQR